MIIHEAGPINMIRTLLIIILVYYVVRFFVKMFAPYLVKKAVDKMQEKASQQRGYANNDNSNVKEGETIIDSKPQNAKSSNNSVGEYVDFEEID